MIIKIYLLMVNIISFISYYIDKRKSIKHKYRIRENYLLLLSVIGGVFGSILSMVLFHHKTKHIKFIIINFICLVLWLYIILNII